MDAALGERVAQATSRAVKNLCDVALEQGVDFVVLAGDIYDGPRRGLHGQRVLRDAFVRLRDGGISVFLAQGNHDPLEEGSALSARIPENVSIFPPGVATTYRFRASDGTLVDVIGVSYGVRHELDDLTPLFPQGSAHAFTVGVLHCTVGSHSEHERYAPTSLDRLLAKEYDYWALGHIHRRTILRDASPAILYSGNTQGLSLKPSERGHKGVTIVEVDGEKVSHELIPVADVCFDAISLRLQSFEGLEELLDAVVPVVQAYELPPLCTLLILRIVLELPCSILQARTLASELRSELNAILGSRGDCVVDSVEITAPTLLRRERSMGGLEGFIQEVDDDELRRQIQQTLGALKLPSALGELGEALEGDRLMEVAEPAKNLVLSLLYGEEL
jgi:DNA repair exonuclease SbcCD nuclease subunit